MKTEKLTKKQRNEIYKKALAIIKSSHYEEFVCNVIGRLIDVDGFSVTENVFPELFTFKETNSCAWLSTEDGFFSEEPYFKSIRVVVLAFCVAMTE